MLRDTFRQTSIVFLVVVSSVYVLRLPEAHPRVTLVVWWAFAVVAVPLARARLSAWAVSWTWWREPVLSSWVTPRAWRRSPRRWRGHATSGTSRSASA